MKSFNQNRTQTNQVKKTYIRPSFFSKLTRKSHTMAAAIIFAVIVLHFASQFIFFQDENNQTANLQTEKTSVVTETIKSVEIEPEYDAENLKIAAMPESVPRVVKSEIRIAPSRTVMSQKIINKSEPRESRAERLRRAEKVLTGF